MSATSMRDLLAQVADAAASHLEGGAGGRSVAPAAAALEAVARLASGVPDAGRDPAAIIKDLAAVGGPAMHSSSGGRSV